MNASIGTERSKNSKIALYGSEAWLLLGINKPSEPHLEICRYSPIVGDARLLALDRKELMIDNIVLQIHREETQEMREGSRPRQK